MKLIIQTNKTGDHSLCTGCDWVDLVSEYCNLFGVNLETMDEWLVRCDECFDCEAKD